jgi:geranylgeranylglycerol-phosphate geranylgeranyltransferase
MAAGGYALNDIYDLASDRVSKPWRPLPSGRVSRRSAALFAGSCWAAGVGISVFAGPVALDFAFAYMALLWLYSFRLKSLGLAGTLAVSAVSSSGFVLGAALGGDAAAGLPPLAVAFAFHFAREVVKASADVAGDTEAGVRTLAVRLGEKGRAVLAASAIALVMALSIVPFAAGVYGLFYLLPVLGVQPLLALCIYLIARSGGELPAVTMAYGRAANILKAVMPVGLLAFLLGRI